LYFIFIFVYLQLLFLRYGDSLDSTEPQRLLPNPNVLVAFSKGMRAVKHYLHRLRIMYLCIVIHYLYRVKGKGKVFPYSLPSVGPGADPGVQAVSPQVT